MCFEPEFWDALREICLREGIGLGELIDQAVQARPAGGQNSAVRVFAVVYFRSAASRNIRTH
jgi:predicted DNA-binding ribbon-helix-helix protein